MRNGRITVEALSSSRTFKNRKALEKFARALEARGAPFDPLEWRILQERHALALNGSVRSPVAEKPAPEPTPHDAKLASAEARVAEEEARYEAAKAGWLAAQLRGRRRLAALDPNRADAFAVHRRTKAEVSRAEDMFKKAGTALRHARAARNAVALAADHYRHEQRTRYHNAADPSRPLTGDELRELLERREQETAR